MSNNPYDALGQLFGGNTGSAPNNNLPQEVIDLIGRPRDLSGVYDPGMTYTPVETPTIYEALNQARATKSAQASDVDLNSVYGAFFDYLKSQPDQNNWNQIVDRINAQQVEQARLDREFQHAEAQIQREWQENLANTAISRQVEDMKRAGINPIVAFMQGSLSGSATPSGAAASGSQARLNVPQYVKSNLIDVLSSLVSMGTDVAKTIRSFLPFYLPFVS